MLNAIKKTIPVLILTLFVVMVFYLAEITGEEVKNWCNENLGPNYVFILFVFFFLLLALAVYLKPTILDSILPDKKSDAADPKPEDISDFYPKIKEYLAVRYDSRLQQKLAFRQPVNLRQLPSDYGASEETKAFFKEYASNQVREGMAQYFEDAGGRLLLVGAPGSGKTTLMLQLVLELLETKPDHLPAIANLATWKKEFGILDTWLREILPAELGVNKTLAIQLLRDNRLILLFDGFDEVQAKDRPSCLEAIGRYGMVAGRQFVISSRKEEYRQVANNAPVNQQVEVGPLTFEQIEAELVLQGQSQPEALRLLSAIRQDALLREVVEVPFYFNTLQFLFSSAKQLSDLNFTAATLEGRQKEIEVRFVAEVLASPISEKYTPEQARYWLSFIGSRMNRENIFVFELIHLQYDWREWSWWQKISLWLYSALFIALPLGALMGMAGGLFSWLILRNINWFLLGIPIGLLIGIMGAIWVVIYARKVNKLPLIESIDGNKWTLKNYIYQLRKIWVKGILSGLIAGVINGLASGLKHGVLSFLFIWIMFGLIFLSSKNDNSLLQITTPYQRFSASMKSLWFSILQHFHLRWLLYRKGLLPLRLVDFLNDMTERHLLESDGAVFKNGKIMKSGATWRFRHRILQEYFAKQWKEEGGTAENPKTEPGQ